MKIEVDGVQYRDFTSASSIRRLDALSNTFGFGTTSLDALPLPFLGGEAVKVFADEELILTGFIELVNVNMGTEDHGIDVQGRDRTGDLLDSSLDSKADIRASTMKRIIENVIAHLDPTTKKANRIQVVDEVKPARFDPAKDVAAPEPGENAFEFLEKLARKRQVLLTSNEDGAVVISSGSGVEVDATIQHLVTDDGSNNVQEFSASYDTTGRFNLYKSISQLNMVAANLAGTVGLGQLVSQGTNKSAIDEEVRKGRQWILVGESSMSGSEDEKRARWQRNMKRAQGKMYAATVSGFRNQAGLLWDVNRIIQVVDEYAGIEAKMLTNSVTFNLGSDGGRTSTIALVDVDAYSVALQEPEKKVGLGLIS